MKNTKKILKKSFLVIILYFLNYFLIYSANTDIKVNSIGFLPNAEKKASITQNCSTFYVKRVSDNTTAFTGTVTGPIYQNDTSENIYIADFSSLTEIGEYYIDVPGVGVSCNFKIADDVYNFPFYTVMRGFYLWRCGTSVDAWYNGNHYYHAACHLNDGYQDYTIGQHTIKDGKKGWHDAGDYGKYTVNAGITLGMLFMAWEHFKDKLENFSLDIPESGGSLPDFLAELKWELDWLLTMQYPDASGRVSHKLTAKNFSAFIMPEDDNADRFFTDWSSAATADFVAVMAMAARIYAPYDSAFANQCLSAAWTSYNFLLNNPNDKQPDLTDFSTGGYTTSDADDRLWAAAEMWETTGDSTALSDFENRASNYSDKTDNDWDWSNVKNLGMFTYLLSTRTGKNSTIENDIRNDLLNDAQTILSDRNNDGYGRTLGGSYYWGCNGSVARTTMILQIANMISPNSDYVNAALDAIGHLFGRNYYCRSYVTGLGINPPMNPHDRRSGADGITEPWPGYLVGGGHTATGWVDDQSSYQTNEIAINWQGALVYALAGFINVSPTFTPTPTDTWNPLTPTYTPTQTFTYTPTPVFTPIRVNCGGNDYTDSQNNLWLADKAYTSGSWGYINGTAGSTSDSIGGTIDDTLYQSERYDANLEYRFDVPDGEYEVNLKFVEMWFGDPNAGGGGAGDRVFDVYIEGNLVINDLDIYSQVGHDYAYDAGPFIVNVTDGTLNISAIATANNAQFCAIEILKYSTPTPTETETYTYTNTETYTETFTLTYTNTETYTETLTLTNTYTETYTETFTPTYTNTETYTETLTPTNTSTETYTETLTLTNTYTETYTETLTPTETNTHTETLTPTNTPTGTFLSPTFTETYTETFTPTSTNTETPTRTFTPTYTYTNTYTYTYTYTYTETSTPTYTETHTYTSIYTNTPTETTTYTETLTPTNTLIETETPSTYTPTIMLTEEIKVYPNPLINSDIKIFTKTKIRYIELKIYTVGYRLVKKIKVEGLETDKIIINKEELNNLAKGIYYYTIVGEDINRKRIFRAGKFVLLK